MKALLCFLALLQFVWTQTQSPATCQAFIDSQNCDFYSQCVETRATCGADGYALGYGDTYCRRFADFSDSFNGQGQVWIQGVRRCLMQALRDSEAYAVAPTSGNACEELRTAAFNSHPRCYVDNGFCSTILFSPTNLQGLFSVIEPQDIFTKETLDQVSRTALRCVPIGLSSLFSAIGLGHLSAEKKFGVMEFVQVFNDPCDTDTNAAMLSIVFLLDASASIGSSNFATMKSSAASAAVTFATTGARVGVVVFGSSASVVVPLQEWENTAQLRTDIENIGYSSGDTDTAEGIATSASALGSEGMRIIILFTDGESNNWQAAENAANAVKQEGISIYAGGIGVSVNEDELNSLVSNPPEDYRVSIENFNADTFDQEVRPLIASTCLTPQQMTTGQQQEGILGKEGDIHSLQYTVPPEGLTLMADMPRGEANVYGSYTIRNPTFFTADFMTGGSGTLTHYIPPPPSSRKRQAAGGDAGNTVFISVIAKKPNTAFTMTATDGNVTIMSEPSAPQNFSIVDISSLGEVTFTWSRPLLTNGIVQEYALKCTPNMTGSPDVTDTISVAIYESNLQQSATLSNLRPHVTYTCSVRAANEAGFGPAVSVLVETLNEGTNSGTKGTATLEVLLLCTVAVLEFMH